MPSTRLPGRWLGTGYGLDALEKKKILAITIILTVTKKN
jgi:hypothetical protein